MLTLRRIRHHPLWKCYEFAMPSCAQDFCSPNFPSLQRIWRHQGLWGASPLKSSTSISTSMELKSTQQPTTFAFSYKKSIECNGFLNKWCSCNFSSNNFFLLINFKLSFNFIKCTDELLDSNEGWAWKYNSMLLLVISLKGDVFQGWKEFIKEKGDRGSQPLLTACCQFREKWNELSELKGSVRGRNACSSLCTFSLEPQEDILMVEQSERWILWGSEHTTKRKSPPFAAKSPTSFSWMLGNLLSHSRIECSTGPSLTIAL